MQPKWQAIHRFRVTYTTNNFVRHRTEVSEPGNRESPTVLIWISGHKGNATTAKLEKAETPPRTFAAAKNSPDTPSLTRHPTGSEWPLYTKLSPAGQTSKLPQTRQMLFSLPAYVPSVGIHPTPIPYDRTREGSGAR